MLLQSLLYVMGPYNSCYSRTVHAHISIVAAEELTVDLEGEQIYIRRFSAIFSLSDLFNVQQQ